MARLLDHQIFELHPSKVMISFKELPPKVSVELIQHISEGQYAEGGGIDLNDWDMPVIRTQFEDEEYEFKDGGEVESLKEGDYIWNALGKKLVVNKITNDIYYLSAFGQIGDSPFFKNNIEKKIATGQWTLKPKYEEGGTTKGFEYSIGGL